MFSAKSPKGSKCLMAVFLVAVFLAASCASAVGIGYSKHSDDTRSIVHGYLEMDGSTKSLDTVTIIGKNNEGKSVEKTADVKKGGYFVFYDLEPGMYNISGMKSESTTVTLMRRENLEKNHFVVDAAKVLYYGKIVIKTKQNGTHNMGLTLDVVAEPDEGTAIKQLLNFFGETPWEAMIKERMNSL